MGILVYHKMTWLKISNQDLLHRLNLPVIDAESRMGYPLFRCNHGHGLACRKGGQCYVDPVSGEEAMTGPMQLR